MSSWSGLLHGWRKCFFHNGRKWRRRIIIAARTRWMSVATHQFKQNTEGYSGDVRPLSTMHAGSKRMQRHGLKGGTEKCCSFMIQITRSEHEYRSVRTISCSIYYSIVYTVYIRICKKNTSWRGKGYIQVAPGNYCTVDEPLPAAAVQEPICGLVPPALAIALSACR